MDTAQSLVTLADTPTWLRAGLSGLSDAQMHRAPQPGEWCLVDILAHLRASNAILAPRVYHVLVRDQPPLIGFDERAWAVTVARAGLHPMVQVELFAGLRAELVGVLRTLDEAAWDRVGAHETRGRLTLREIVIDLAEHELEHYQQWNAARIALGYIIPQPPPISAIRHAGRVRSPRRTH